MGHLSVGEVVLTVVTGHLKFGDYLRVSLIVLCFGSRARNSIEQSSNMIV